MWVKSLAEYISCASRKIPNEGRGRPLPEIGDAVTADGQRAVSAPEDKTLKVWELDSGRELCTLTGHADWQ